MKVALIVVMWLRYGVEDIVEFATVLIVLTAVVMAVISA